MIQKLFKFLEKLERYFPQVFWPVICILSLVFNFHDSNEQFHSAEPNPVYIAQNVSWREKFKIKKKEKFDWAYHRKLEKHFPDWKERIDYQRKQEKFFNSALKKQKQLQGLIQLRDQSKFYTKDELDSIDYFYGRGIYAAAQDPSEKPNIFDTRQTFLRKMHDPELCEQFLNSYKKRKL